MKLSVKSLLIKEVQGGNYSETELEMLGKALDSISNIEHLEFKTRIELLRVLVFFEANFQSEVNQLERLLMNFTVRKRQVALDRLRMSTKNPTKDILEAEAERNDILSEEEQKKVSRIESRLFTMKKWLEIVKNMYWICNSSSQMIGYVKN